MKVAYINRGEAKERKLSKKEAFHEQVMQMIKDQEERDRREAIQFFDKILKTKRNDTISTAS